jgi:hypothetical protein
MFKILLKLIKKEKEGFVKEQKELIQKEGP